MRASEFLIETPVESSWLFDLSYNRNNKILNMTVSNRTGVYRYIILNISRTMFDRWRKAPSKGVFFHHNIKGKYVIRRTK